MRIAAAIVATQLAACSVLFIDAPPRPAPMPPPDCHIESAAPAADLTMFALTFVTSMIAMIGFSTEAFNDRKDPMTRNEALLVTAGATGAATFGFSGVWGLNQVSRCRRIHGLPRPER